MHTFVYMAKKNKPAKKTTRMVRVKDTVVEKVKTDKAPGQSIGGYIEQVVNSTNGHSNTDLRSNA